MEEEQEEEKKEATKVAVAGCNMQEDAKSCARPSSAMPQLSRIFNGLPAFYGSVSRGYIRVVPPVGGYYYYLLLQVLSLAELAFSSHSLLLPAGGLGEGERGRREKEGRRRERARSYRIHFVTSTWHPTFGGGSSAAALLYS